LKKNKKKKNSNKKFPKYNVLSKIVGASYFGFDTEIHKDISQNGNLKIEQTKAQTVNTELL